MANDPTTNQLRDDRWRPRAGLRYACGCRPALLCALHRTIRATEEHNPDAVPTPSNAISEAWTCPDCSRSYWAPAEWEPELWAAVRDHAQRIHGRRHLQDRITAADAGGPG
jgi:hypothetical protein